MSMYDSAQQMNNKNHLNNNVTKKPSLKVDFQKSKHFKKTCIDYAVQMEHSYSRDCRPIEGINGLTTRTLMVHKPPQCPSCHAHPLDEGLDSDEANHPPIPPYNENAAKEAMHETTKIALNVRNSNPDDEEWEERVSKLGWTTAQEKLFSKITRIFDLDNLARMATIGRQHEPVHRRVIIDRSVHRVRQVFASISWDSKLTQWLHSILMEYLPPIYMAIYLDILQTLKTKLPTLMDKMLFGKPMNINQELLTPVMKKQWDPIIPQKQRKLPSNAIILIVPSTSYIVNGMSSRMQKWCQLFTTMGQIVQVQIPNASTLNKQPINQVCEHLVHLSRVKVQDLRREQPNSHIVLVGFNAGAAIALQVSLMENVNSVVCLGFSYNTINGMRGAPDDQILEITTPIIFVIGQNSARTSQEEMESLREKMQSETSLIVVGSADDVLRVPKSKRQIEGVTQSMVDSMVMDEVFEFVKNCIQNPPGPRQINTITTLPVQVALSQARKITTPGNHSAYTSVGAGNNLYGRKRKISQGGGGSDAELPPTKVKYLKNSTLIGRPRTRPLPNTASNQTQVKSNQLIPQVSSNEILNMAIQSILPDNCSNSDKQQSSKIKDESEDESQILSALELLTQSSKKEMKSSPLPTASTGIISTTQQQHQTRTLLTAPSATQKIKMIPTNQFIHVKPPTQQNSQRIYTIKTSPMLGSANAHSQVFTVKTAGSQLTSSNVGNPANTIVLNSPPKFTVYKSGANLLNTQTTAATGVGGKSTSSSADLSSTNILDLPILFADSEGNIHDTAPISASSTTPSASPTIIFNQQHQSASQQTGILSQSSSGKLILNTTNSSMIQKPKPNKVVYINRSTMKPMSANIISSKTLPPLKYTKLVVTNPKTAAPSLVPKASGQQRLDAEKGITTITIQKPSATAGGGVSISGGIVKTAATAIGQSSAIIGTTTAGTKQFQPIIINVDSDKTGAFKNMLKVTGTSAGNDPSQIKQTILLKPGGLKTLPVTGLKPGILNRNLTVRKVNILQAKPGPAISQITSVVQGSATAASSSSGANVTATATATTVAASPASGNDSQSSASPSSGTQNSQTQNIVQIQRNEN